MVFKRYSQAVRVKALKRVVSMMMLELRVPSCPRLRTMTKPLTVVGLASMATAATSFSPRKPMATPTGRKAAAKITSLNTEADTAGFQRPRAFYRSKEAPSAISPSGVAVADMLLTVF